MSFEFTDFSSMSVLVLTVTNKKYWGLRKDINEDLKFEKLKIKSLGRTKTRNGKQMWY